MRVEVNGCPAGKVTLLLCLFVCLFVCFFDCSPVNCRDMTYCLRKFNLSFFSLCSEVLYNLYTVLSFMALEKEEIKNLKKNFGALNIVFKRKLDYFELSLASLSYI